jgi:glycosyltransferase involved in cell wall biosynthesis
LGLSDYVIFTGFRTDIPQITAIFDIAVLASFYEGLGRVLLEAMVLGKPVIATRVGGIVDVVDDGKTGILVPPNDSEALAQALIKLLLDGELRRRMGEAGRAKIDAKFSARTMVSQIEKVYEELIGERTYTDGKMMHPDKKGIHTDKRRIHTDDRYKKDAHRWDSP